MHTGEAPASSLAITAAEAPVAFSQFRHPAAASPSARPHTLSSLAAFPAASGGVYVGLLLAPYEKEGSGEPPKELAEGEEPEEEQPPPEADPEEDEPEEEEPAQEGESRLRPPAPPPAPSVLALPWPDGCRLCTPIRSRSLSLLDALPAWFGIPHVCLPSPSACRG